MPSFIFVIFVQALLVSTTAAQAENSKYEAHVVVSSSSPATVRAAEYEYVPVWVDHPPPPPPPPLDKIHPNWVPLYFLLALIVAWVLVMIAVQYSLRCWGPGSSGERKPLYYSTRPARKRDFGEPTWMGVDPSVIDANMSIDASVRAAFIRKVYAILATQLVATVAIVVGLIYASFYKGNEHVLTAFGVFITGPGYYLSLLFLIIALFVLCCLMCVRDKYPENMICLAVFTACISLEVGIICVLYYDAGFGSDLLLAFVLTAATFLLLTVFTIVSRIDFTFLGPLLCIGLFVLLFWSCILSICMAFGGYSASWSLAWVIVGMIIFVGFIIYDTYMIVTRLGVDDYVIAAIELYLDMINMFMLILSCLTLCGGDNR